MRRVAVNKLKPGMKIGRAVINANEQVLLNEGIILTAKFIRKLKKLNIPAVYIDDGFLPDIKVDDVIPDKIRYQAIQQTKTVFRDFYYTRKLSGLENMERIVNLIIEELIDNKNVMVNLADIRSTDEYTFGHSVNTCVLSLITAIRMGYKRQQLFQLAMGAIMHDLGKTRIAAEILNKPGKLTNEEFEQVKKHAEFGYEILARDDTIKNNIPPLLALQHHERYDGSGYPQGLKGQAIHKFAAIVGIADMYDALTADRVYRKAYSSHEAFEMLAATGDYLFDYEVVKHFLHHVAAYPVGSLVKLNTGEVGVVTKNRPGYSLYPEVRILFLPNREPLVEPYEIDLASQQNLVINKVIDDDAELILLKHLFTSR